MLPVLVMLRRPRARRAARAHALRAPGFSGALSVLLISLGLLFGQGATLLHLWMVPHTTCEHGELVHAAPHAAAPAQGTKQPGVEAAAPDGNEHEHCDVNARIHRPEAVGPAVAEATLLCIEPAVTLEERSETRPVNLLSLAPKSSPPSHRA